MNASSSGKLSLDELWDAPSGERNVFEPENYLFLPESARRYLGHALAPGTPLAEAVRLTMHGEIKLGGYWRPFAAEQVIRPARGFLWSATVKQRGLPIRGSDRLIDGAGEMHWKLFGLFPLMNASGPNIARSAIGRFQAEAVWLPSMLCARDTLWTEADGRRPRATLCTLGEETQLALEIEDSGRVAASSLLRWGNPDGGAYRYVPFGGHFDEERTFDGVTIPTRVRVGWHFGTPRFESEGEFFRATVESATFK